MLVDGVWIQGRCEREISAASAKGEKNRENGKKGGRPKKNITGSETDENPNGLETGNHLGSENNLSQTPDTRHQTPDLQDISASGTSNGVGQEIPQSAPCSAGEVSKAMRSNGIPSQPADPRIMAIAEQGVSLDTVQAACAEAKRAKPNESVGVGYVVAIIERWGKEAAAMKVKGAKPPQQTNSKQDSRAAAAASIGLGAPNHDDNGDYNTIDGQTRFVG